MKQRKNCEFCSKEFEFDEKRRPKARFCSPLCNRKLLRKQQLEKHNEYLANETEDQKKDWLRMHYEKFVVKQDGCWIWTGYKSLGYPILGHRGKIMKAHRVSYQIHIGEIPPGAFVLHKCDNPPCTNPDHLFLGNHTVNMRDMLSKGRNIKGDPRNKLTDDLVLEIKNLIDLGVSMVKIGKKYGVHRSTISRIKENKYWKHIT